MNEKPLIEATEKAEDVIQQTHKGPQNLQSGKRRQDTPGEEEEQKEVTNDKSGSSKEKEDSEWRIVDSQRKIKEEEANE